jgi:FkbM family methyltransferase
LRAKANFNKRKKIEAGMKQSFTFGGMNIAVRSMHLTPKIEQALASGHYENAERTAITLHVMPQDRVLDLGGGIGCTGVVAGRIVGGENLMILEANGDLIPDIAENLSANGVFGAELVNAAVVADKTTKQVSFFKSKGFWAGSLHAGNTANSREIKVLAMPISVLFGRFKPTVIICDTEGVETEIFRSNLPVHVRLIIM